MLGSYNPLLLESFPSNHKVFAILEDIVEGTYSLLTPKLLKWERALMHGQGRFFLFLLAVPSAVRVVALHAVPKKAQRQQSLLVEARTQLAHIREWGKCHIRPVVCSQLCGLSVVTHEVTCSSFPAQTGEMIPHFWI